MPGVPWFVLASCISTAPAEAVGTPANQEVDRNLLRLDVGGGVAALSFPLWGGTELKLEHLLGSRGIVGALAYGSLGSSADGTQLGELRLNVFIGLDVAKFPRLAWRLLVHAGAVSILPLANLGLDSQLAVFPVIWDHFRWTLGVTSTVEFPFRYVSEIYSETAFPAGAWTPALRLTAGGYLGAPLGLGGAVGLHGLVSRRF